MITRRFLWRALWQIIDTVIPYGVVWYLMYLCLSVSWLSWWAVVPLAVLAGGLLVRVFIIFHDCGHGSFFKSRAANDTVGFLAGILTFTPYYHWRWEHNIHHSSAGDLDKRHADGNDPFRWLMASYSTLKTLNAEQVRVDEIGRIWRVTTKGGGKAA